MKEITGLPIATKPFPLALIVARFNEEITQALLYEAKARLKTLTFPENFVTIVHVPGAIEIPIAALKLAKTGCYKAIVALGAVVRGETDHYKAVCESVTAGCLQVSLSQEIPVIFEVLMTDSELLAQARVNKGAVAIDCAIEMAALLEHIDHLA